MPVCIDDKKDADKSLSELYKDEGENEAAEWVGEDD